VGSHTRWELTTWADFQLCLHRLLMSTGCKSSHNGFLDVSRSSWWELMTSADLLDRWINGWHAVCLLTAETNFQCIYIAYNYCIYCMSVVTYKISAAEYVIDLVQRTHHLMPTLDALLSTRQQLLCITDKYRNLSVTCRSSSTKWLGLASVRSWVGNSL